MLISEYDDEDIIDEIKRRGLKIEVHVSGVELEIFVGGIEMGNIHAK